MAGCLAALCLLAAGPAEGLSPPVPVKATVYFSNGGRIVSMKADGSERTVLTRKSARPRNTIFGDRMPEVSPDGQQIVFLRLLETNPSADDYGEPAVMVASADGTAVRRIELSVAYSYISAGWMPDGRLLVSRVEAKGQRPKSSLIAVDDNTGVLQVLHTLKPVKDLIGDYPALRIVDPVASPDGSQVLFGLDQMDNPKVMSGLQVLDLASGERRLIDRLGTGGSWSPDSQRIVYSQSTRSGKSTEVCWTDLDYICSNSTHLVTVRADGTGAKRLTGDIGDARGPDWSADGSRIAFQGNRNMPETAESYEIYSITPDGKCLTWLTNGAPASLEPAWTGAAGQDFSAGGCGDRGLKPLQEIGPPGKEKGTMSLWLGATAGWRLLSGVDSYFGPAFTYSDCAYFQPAECGAMFGTFNIPVCALRGDFAKSGFATNAWDQRRGLPYDKSFGDGSRIDFVYSGNSLFYMMGDDNRSSADADDAIRYLRVYGKKLSAGLPPIAVPRQDLRRHRQVVGTVRRTGSVKSAAARLGIPVKLVRANLSMSRFLKRFGPATPVSCPKRSRGR